MPIWGLDGCQLCSSSVVKLLTPTGRETKRGADQAAQQRGDLERRKEEVNRNKLDIRGAVEVSCLGGGGVQRWREERESQWACKIKEYVFGVGDFGKQDLESEVERWMLRFFMNGSGILIVHVMVSEFSRRKGGEERRRTIWGCWFWSRELILRSLMDRVPAVKLHTHTRWIEHSPSLSLSVLALVWFVSSYFSLCVSKLNGDQRAQSHHQIPSRRVCVCVSSERLHALPPCQPPLWQGVLKHV